MIISLQCKVLLGTLWSSHSSGCCLIQTTSQTLLPTMQSVHGNDVDRGLCPPQQDNVPCHTAKNCTAMARRMWQKVQDIDLPLKFPSFHHSWESMGHTLIGLIHGAPPCRLQNWLPETTWWPQRSCVHALMGLISHLASTDRTYSGTSHEYLIWLGSGCLEARPTPWAIFHVPPLEGGAYQLASTSMPVPKISKGEYLIETTWSLLFT